MNNLEFAAYLREMADLYEKNQDMAQFYNHGNGGTEPIFCDNLAQLSATVKALGGGTKSSDDDSVQYHPKRYPHIRVYAFHSNVCVKVKTGTKLVPAIPEKFVPAQEAQYIPAQPEREEEVSEWVCPAFTKPFVESAHESIEAPALQIEAPEELPEELCF